MSASLIAYYATVATLTPLFFIALVFQTSSFAERLGGFGVMGGLLAVGFLIVSETVSLGALASGHSTQNRVTVDAFAVYLGALFIAFPLIDRIFEGIIGGPDGTDAQSEFHENIARLRRVARVTLALSAPAAAFWIAKGA